MFNKTLYCSILDQHGRRLMMLLSAIILFSACVPRSNHPFLEEGRANTGEVLEYLNDVLETDPDNNNALYQKAQIQFELRQLKASLNTIDKALKIDFTNNDYYFLRGKITAQAGAYDESIEAFKQAEALGNNSHELYQRLSRSYLELNQPDKSREVVNRLLKLDEGDEAHILAGETLLALNDSIEALKQFKLALNTDSSNVDALMGVKNIYIGKGQLTEAETIVDMLITLDSDRTEYKLEKANLLKKRGDLDTAKVILKRTIQQDSSDQVIIQLAELEYDLGNYDSTLYYLAKYQGSEKLDMLLLNARALDRNRNFAESASIYSAILESDSTNEIALNELTTLRGKMAYLQRITRERAALDSARSNPPPVLNRREIVN